MKSGKDKALALKALLGDKADKLDAFLSEEAKEKMQGALTDDTLQDPQLMNAFVKESVDKIAVIQDEFSVPDEAASEELLEPIDSGFDAIEEVQEEEDSSIDYEGIVETLQQQDPQLTAFLLSRLEKDKKEALLLVLPEEFKQRVQVLKTETLSISDELYQHIYHSIFPEQ